jgi:N-methylhydantoinase A
VAALPLRRHSAGGNEMGDTVNLNSSILGGSAAGAAPNLVASRAAAVDSRPSIRVGFDIGGTFTDLVLTDERHNVLINEKLLGNAADVSQAVIEGIVRLLDRSGCSLGDIGAMVVGATTIVANTIIEGKGAKTALVTTRGFGNVLTMGRELRYDSQRINLPFPKPLVDDDLCLEVGERLDVSGQVIEPLDLGDVDAAIDVLGRAKVEAVAVSFLHAYRNPDHEQKVAALIERALPDVFVSLSSEISPEIGEYVRASTTVANAYVQPFLKRQLLRLDRRLKEIGYGNDLFIMLSNGGTIGLDGALRYPIRLIESGPAAGALASTFFAETGNGDNLISFDMGGTTAKACLVHAGHPTITKQFEAARIERFSKGSGIPLRVPVMDMIEIGAGGGSIARLDDIGLITVGPDSAAASPGPACYGLGGTEATVTDADLVLGYIDPDHFAGGTMPLDRDAAIAALTRLGEELGVDTIEAAWGVHEIVNENMSQATKVHIAEYGKDPRNYRMVALGGAGPLHAVGVARKVGLKTVTVPRLAGVGSAFGLLISPIGMDFWRSSVRVAEQLRWDEVSALLEDLREEAVSILSGTRGRDLNFAYSLDARYAGQGSELSVELSEACLGPDIARHVIERFQETYQKLYGRRIAAGVVEAVTWKLLATAYSPDLTGVMSSGATRADEHGRPEKKGTQQVYLHPDGWVTATVYDHADLMPGDTVAGPALVRQPESTILIGAEETGTVDARSSVVVHLGEGGTR